jgi:hypothetical protein
MLETYYQAAFENYPFQLYPKLNSDILTGRVNRNLRASSIASVPLETV